jgi:opacity protein-like surface antigen
MLFHIKTHRGTVGDFLINSIKIRFLMLKSRKTVSVLVRDGSRLNEKLAFKRQNSKFAVDFALLRKNHGKRSKKYGTLCGRHKRSSRETVGYVTVRYGHGRRINSDLLLYFLGRF